MDNVKQAIELLEAMNNTRELQLDYCKFHHIEVPARSGHGLFWFDTTTTLHKKALALLKQEPALPEPKTGTCGRCYDEPVEVFPANCNEKPENLIGQPIGQYHCPDCGAMVVAGSPHPNMCQKCIDRKHPAFDLLKQEQPKPKITDVRMECLKCHRITTVGNAIPDIDGEGSLGCPFCYDKDLERVALVEQPLSDSEQVFPKPLNPAQAAMMGIMPDCPVCHNMPDSEQGKFTDRLRTAMNDHINLYGDDFTIPLPIEAVTVIKACDIIDRQKAELSSIKKLCDCYDEFGEVSQPDYVLPDLADNVMGIFAELQQRIQQLEAEIDNLKAMLSEHSQKDK